MTYHGWRLQLYTGFNKNLNKIQRVIIHGDSNTISDTIIAVFGYTITQLLTTLLVSLYQIVAFFV